MEKALDNIGTENAMEPQNFDALLKTKGLKTLEAALAYVRLGYKVLPLKPGTKEPFGSLVPRGHKDATANPELIRTWFSGHPEAGIGLLAEEDVLILDIDDPEARNVLDALCGELLGRAPQQKTPRGGTHIFLRVPKGYQGRLSARVNAMKGLDIKGLGKGYVAVSPTQVDTGSYSWTKPLVPPQDLPEAPQPLIDFLLEGKQRIPQPPAQFSFSEQRFQSLLAGHVRKIEKTPEGQRHNTLLASSLSIGGLLGQVEQNKPGLIEDVFEKLKEAAEQSGLPTEEAIRTIKWGLEKGMERPSFPPTSPQAIPNLKATLHPIDLKQAPRQVEWAVENLIPKGALTFWYGPPGVGKSAAVSYLAVASAGGEERFGIYKVRPNRVAILDFEEPEGRGYHIRIGKLQAQYEFDIDKITLMAKKNLTEVQGLWSEVESLLSEEEIGLVFLDSFSRAFPLVDFNRGQDVLKALEILMEIAAKTNVGFVVIDHTPKLQKGEKPSERGPRGSSAKMDVARALFALEQEEKYTTPTSYVLRFLCTKMSYAPKPEPFYLLFEETQNSLVVSPFNAPQEESALSRARSAIIGLLSQAGERGMPQKQLTDELTKEGKLSLSTVKRALKDLKAQGLVEWEVRLNTQGNPIVLRLPQNPGL